MKRFFAAVKIARSAGIPSPRSALALPASFGASETPEVQFHVLW